MLELRNQRVKYKDSYRQVTVMVSHYDASYGYCIINDERVNVERCSFMDTSLWEVSK